MTRHFSFRTLSTRCSDTVANVFIHGYCAGHDLEDRLLLADCIPPGPAGCINIFAFWQSGHLLDVAADSLNNLIRGAEGITHGVWSFALHFSNSRSQATEAGSRLLDELEDYLLREHPYVQTVNLVGHSLGARVAVRAVQTLGSPSCTSALEIGDVLLMAGAVELDDEQTLHMTRVIQGRLVNAYSTADRVLLLNGLEASIGRRATRNAENFEMDGFGHTDYWPQLATILARTRFAGSRFGGKYARSVSQDPVVGDRILHDVLLKTSVFVKREIARHLQTSIWTNLPDDYSVRDLTREIQQLGGHCLVNLARGRGLRYAAILHMLADHFDASAGFHQCVRVSDLEAQVVAAFFRHYLSVDDSLASDPLGAAQSLCAEDFCSAVDRLADRLTLPGWLRHDSPVQTRQPAPRVLLRRSSSTLSMAASGLFSQRLLNALGDVPESLDRAFRSLTAALKPGYCALVPAVALIFYVRVNSGNEELL